MNVSNLRFFVTIVAILVFFMAFFWMLATIATKDIEGDLQRQKDCIEAGLQYIYDYKTSQYNCQK